MATISLKNPQKDVFLFTLYHEVYCKENACSCNIKHVLRSVPGGLKYFDVINPRSVHLDGFQIVSLNDTALKIQQVESALKSGRLVKVEVEARSDNTESVKE